MEAGMERSEHQGHVCNGYCEGRQHVALACFDAVISPEQALEEMQAAHPTKRILALRRIFEFGDFGGQGVRYSRGPQAGVLFDERPPASVWRVTFEARTDE